MGLLASILRSDLGDCSAGGISSRANRVVIVNAEGPFRPDDRTPGVAIIDHPAGPQYGMIAVPVDENFKPQTGGMAGGTFVWTSDSRMAPRHPVSLHDRFEG